MISLSVVVPVYNAGKYLRECIDSLLATESDNDMELIIVDDGSADGSGTIADQYSQSHSNIKVIHKQNEGPSDARNTGLLNSQGKYVFFCDADDTVDSSRLINVLNLLSRTDSDIIVWDAALTDENGIRIKSKDERFYVNEGIESDSEELSGKDYLYKKLANGGNYATVVWMGVYRRLYLLENKLFFKERLMHEDDLWVPLVFLNAGSVRYVPGIVYYYRQHSSSRNTLFDENRPAYVESLLYIYPYLFSYCDNTLDGGGLHQMFEANLVRKYLHKIFKYRFFNYGYGDKIDLGLLWRKSGRLIDRLRISYLYLIRIMRCPHD